MNSVIKRAGQEISFNGDAFNPASMRPSTSAMTKPTAAACRVTTNPFRRMGKIETAKAQLLDVSQAMPSNISGSPRAPAAYRPFQHHHQSGKYEGHPEIHKQQQGIDRRAVDRKSTRLNSSHVKISYA